MQLHTLPRSGGVLDQPITEFRRLEKMLDVYVRYDRYKDRKSDTRERNRARHQPNTTTITEGTE